MSKAVVIASGGMDSATLAWHYHTLNYDVHLIGFNYGQRHIKELDYLKRQADKLKAELTIVNMDFMRDLLKGSSLTDDQIEVPDGHYREETMRITVVPNRNAIMLSIAVGIAVANKADIVATGIHGGDHYIYPDCRPSFFEPFAEAMKQATIGHANEAFKVEAPFIEIGKDDIAEYGSRIGVDYSLTWSCYKGGEIHCGSCGTCFERREAFELAGVPDPTEYKDKPIYEKPEYSHG